MAQLTKNDIREVLQEMGVVTEITLKKELGKVRRDISKTKKELQASIAKVALTSPTINQFNTLEKRVTKLETSVN